MSLQFVILSEAKDVAGVVRSAARSESSRDDREVLRVAQDDRWDASGFPGDIR